jgi:ABC-type uncharacterized transport system ATPase subunit
MAATVGYLPEERGLYRNEPVFDTMVYFAVMHGLGRSDAKKRVLAYLERVGLGDKAHERLIGSRTANSKSPAWRHDLARAVAYDP